MVILWVMFNIYFLIQVKEEVIHTEWINITNSTAVQNPHITAEQVRTHLLVTVTEPLTKIFKLVFNFFIQVMVQRHLSWKWCQLKLLLPSDRSHTNFSASVQLFEEPYGKWIRKLLRVKKNKPALPPREMSAEPQSPKRLKMFPWEGQAKSLNAHPASFVPLRLWTEHMNWLKPHFCLYTEATSSQAD